MEAISVICPITGQADGAFRSCDGDGYSFCTDGIQGSAFCRGCDSHCDTCNVVVGQPGKGGAFNAERAMVYGAKGNGIKVDEFGHLILKSGSIQSKKDALVASEGANITVQGGSLSSTTGAALKVDKRHQRHGPTRVRMDGCDLDKVAEEQGRRRRRTRGAGMWMWGMRLHQSPMLCAEPERASWE